MMDKDDPTYNIIAAYIPVLLSNIPPDDELAKYLRGILVSRHRYLSIEETADCPQNWGGALFDVAKYYVSANVVFEVDRALYQFWAGFGGVLRQKVPIGKNTITSETVWKYLIGFQMEVEDMMTQPNFHVETEKAMKIIDVILSHVPEESA